MEQKSGFTLIEIIVAMAILAVVASSLLGNFFSSQKKGRDAKRKSDLKQIQNALEAYANDHQGLYPIGDASGRIGGFSWGAEFHNPSHIETVYMKALPQDSKSTQKYWYVSTDGVSYKIYACLENSDDAKAQTYDPNGTTGDNECGGCQYRDGDGNLVNTDCNYGVSSSNESL